MQQPKLFATLPDFVATPDGMAIDAEGNLILACPNYGDLSKPGCLVKFDHARKARKWVDVPVNPETGHAFPMGIAFGPDGDLYVVRQPGLDGPQRPGLPRVPVPGTHPAAADPRQHGGEDDGRRPRHGTPQRHAHQQEPRLRDAQHALPGQGPVRVSW